MKKLKLRLVNIQGTEILSRDQLKKVVGGTNGSECAFRSDCGEGETCVYGFGPAHCESVERDGECSPTAGHEHCGNGQRCLGMIDGFYCG